MVFRERLLINVCPCKAGIALGGLVLTVFEKGVLRESDGHGKKRKQQVIWKTSVFQALAKAGFDKVAIWLIVTMAEKHIGR